MKGLEFYEKKVSEIKALKDESNKKLLLFSYIRGIMFIAFSVIAYFIYKQGFKLTFILLELSIVCLFMAIVLIHQKEVERRRKLNILNRLNEDGIKRVKGEFSSFEDNGEEFIDEKSAFTNDLDVFGKNSLFQLINTTITVEGRKVLYEILSLKREYSKEEIEENQKAIQELGDNIAWRQNFYVEGSTKTNKNNDAIEFIKWSVNKTKRNSGAIFISYLFIAITLISIGLSIAKILPPSYVILVLMINFVVIKALSKNAREDIDLLYKSKNAIKANARLLALIENEEFKSKALKDIKGEITSQDKTCTKEMKRISNIVDWIGDSKGNAFYFLMNIVFFSDIFIMKNAWEWRERNGSKVAIWLSIVGEIDALNSISNLHFDFGSWTYPTISNDMMVEGKSIKHPLIGERAVGNSYNLSNGKKVTLITGSNMSGKSTFLRTIGINLLLSYIGAPVSADEFKCGKMNIYTCMRTKDNLEESISSFYAEILRIKLLLEATKSGEKVFFLLDEIFKGTNSKDRHTGATVLIKQLIKEGAIGLVSTHDLELCDLEESIKEIDNYNFREYYKDNKINFDYKLRKGKSETQNAIHLMRLAGIDFK
ncbi:MAG: MutS-related protein [Clostridium sp.]